MRKFMIDESGQGMTEYIIIVLLVALVAIATVRYFGQQIRGGFDDARKSIKNAR